MNPMVRIIDGDKILDREMTALEFTQYEKDKDEQTAQTSTANTAKAAKDAARQAVLDKLGITADEAALLLS